MTTINLRELYPWYTEDAFIEVSDEVAAFLEEDKRLQINYAQYIRDNRAFYSLDAGDGIEADALNLPEQPDEALERMELERLLKEGLAQLTPAQRRRVIAYIVGGLSQLQIAARENILMDGRDIGTCVLPNAQLKIYLTASVHTRALRRYKELQEKGTTCVLEEIEKDIEDRDYRDMHREIAPLKVADDAEVIDSSDMTIDEVVEKILSLAK
mgnify:CR=1 FL=1